MGSRLNVSSEQLVSSGKMAKVETLSTGEYVQTLGGFDEKIVRNVFTGLLSIVLASYLSLHVYSYFNRNNPIKSGVSVEDFQDEIIPNPKFLGEDYPFFKPLVIDRIDAFLAPCCPGFGLESHLPRTI